MRSKRRGAGLRALAAWGAVLGLALMWAAAPRPALAASQADLEAKIKMLEQSLGELKAQLGQVQTTQQQQQEAVQVVAAKAAKDSMPKWLERISLYGDLTLRYEGWWYDKFKGKETDQRTRWRFRSHFGVKSMVNEDLEVGIRMATAADDDPTSTVQTMTNWFGEKSWGIDRAYAKYNPGYLDKVLTVTAGKFETPFVRTAIMWDVDVQPEGAYVNLRFNKKGAFQPFLTVAGLVVKEQASDNPGDAYVYAPQAGFYYNQDPFKVTFATSYYDWDGFEKVGNFSSTALRGNTAKANGELSDFGVWDVYAKLTYKIRTDTSVDVFGHWMRNLREDMTGRAAGKDTGYTFAAALNWAMWKFQAEYRSIEANATPGYFGDSEFQYNNREGWVGRVSYSPFKYTVINLNWYHSFPIDDYLTGAAAGYDMFQVETTFQF
ncbi:MAG: putative porin [Pseudomonadota bacterium]